MFHAIQAGHLCPCSKVCSPIPDTLRAAAARPAAAACAHGISNAAAGGGGGGTPVAVAGHMHSQSPVAKVATAASQAVSHPLASVGTTLGTEFTLPTRELEAGSAIAEENALKFFREVCAKEGAFCLFCIGRASICCIVGHR